MKRLIAIIAACLFVSVAGAADSTNSPVFQIRLILDAPSTNSEQMSATYDIGNGMVREEKYDVQKVVPFDLSAVKSAKAIENKRYNEPEIEITFTDAAKKRWAEYTSQNIGKRVAVIVFGKINCAPKIASAIPGGKVSLVGKFSTQEAENLAAKINDAITKP